MLDFIIWIVIIALFALSFIGLIYPIIPSVLVIWVGFILYRFVSNPDELTLTFWLVMIVFTIFLFVADILANSYFVKRYGGSKWGERGAAVAVILGSFIFPPFGIIFVPFLTVFLIELLQRRPPQDAARASVGSLLGFLGGTVAKIFIQLIMIIWFFIVIIF